jgi:nitrite reductase (NADH) large subunit
MVKTCVGDEFCRFGVQDAITTGVELERRLENLYTPHKTKMAVTGCPRNCSEATVKDIGLVGQRGSWQVVVGGAAGKHVRKADLLITVETTDEALDAAMVFFQYYREQANYLERTYDFVERIGHRKGAKRHRVCANGDQESAAEALTKSRKRCPATLG